MPPPLQSSALWKRKYLESVDSQVGLGTGSKTHRIFSLSFITEMECNKEILPGSIINRAYFLDWLLNYLHFPVTRVSSKQSNFFSVWTETKRNSICFGWFSVCFVKLITIFFGLFRCFGSISKQPKQTHLFRNKPKN
jgi:hypothetical protein